MMGKLCVLTLHHWAGITHSCIFVTPANSQTRCATTACILRKWATEMISIYRRWNKTKDGIKSQGTYTNWPRDFFLDKHWETGQETVTIILSHIKEEMYPQIPSVGHSSLSKNLYRLLELTPKTWPTSSSQYCFPEVKSSSIISLDVLHTAQ